MSDNVRQARLEETVILGRQNGIVSIISLRLGKNDEVLAGSADLTLEFRKFRTMGFSRKSSLNFFIGCSYDSIRVPQLTCPTYSVSQKHLDKMPSLAPMRP